MPIIALDDLLAAVAMHNDGADRRWTGPNLPLALPRVFGGQILAQAITAAARVEPDKTVKSIHVLFGREARSDEPLHYSVDLRHSGRTFASTAISVDQGDRAVAAATVLLHDAGEAGPVHQLRRARLGPPDAATAIDLPMVPWETRVLDGIDLDDAAVGPPTFAFWMRALDLPSDPTTHQALLAHATDLTLIGTSLRAFPGLSQADAHGRIPTAVVSHTLWFHQPVRLDGWTVVDQEVPIAAAGRSYGRGEVRDAEGGLMASFAQEAMVRVPEEP